jgi:hypothetical protein
LKNRAKSRAAQRICEALQAAGIEVWFDKSELRGGDDWDQTIRRRIRDCRLFIPVISRTTETRGEGYFRREWKLAVDRTEDMAGDAAFLVPVVIDNTSCTSARVPPKFRDLQWSHLPAGETPATFVYDWRTQGKPHPARVLGGGLLAIEIIARTVLASTRVAGHSRFSGTHCRLMPGRPTLSCTPEE